MLKPACINGKEALLVCQEKGCMENHIVCNDPQCGCQGEVDKSGHRNRVMLSTVMQRLAEMQRQQDAVMEKQAEIISSVETCYKQLRMALQQSQQRFSEFKRVMGMPRSYLDFKIASIGMESWRGNYIHNLMQDNSNQDMIVIKQSAHDIRVFSEDTLRRVSALITDYTEVLVRNRQREQSEIVAEQEEKVREFRDRELTTKDIKKLNSNIRSLTIVKCISMSFWGTVDWSSVLNELTSRRVLTHLEIRNCGLTIKHVEKLKSMNQLEILSLENNNFGNECTAPLAKLINLKKLYLSSNNLDDGCIDNLIKLRDLMLLDIANTKISQNGIHRLKSSLRGATIHS